MNEVAMMDTNLAVERTPELIAIEINSIKEQTRKILLFNSIEIGRRLSEAKTMLEHGQWGEWLEKSVNYSQRTASNLMRIFDEYGSSQITLFCDNAKSQALANLSYTQAVALLGIPQDDRETFIQEHELDSMSTRELQQAVKEKQELEAKIRELEVGWEGSKRVAESAKADLKELQEAIAKEKEESRGETCRLEALIDELKQQIIEAEASGNHGEVEQLQESLNKTDGELKASLQKIKDLECKLKETPIEVTAAPVVEKVPEDVEREIQDLRERNKELEAKETQQSSTATVRFSVYFDTLVKGFKDLLNTLEEIREADTAAHENYRNAVAGLLGKMSERLR